jgi:outer membrane lipoprotein carrier protein
MRNEMHRPHEDHHDISQSAFRIPHLVLAGSLLAASLTAQDPGPVLDRASAAYQTVTTLSADFTQVIINPLVGAPDTTRGTLYQMRPNHFAMRFRHPKGDRIVADGRYLWIYTPSTTPGQVIRTAIPETGTTGPNLLGQFVEHPRERYRARYIRMDSLATGLADVVELVPRAEGAPYRQALVWVNRESGLLTRLEIVEASGQRREIALARLRVNGGVPQREFTFSPSAGVRVVSP